MKKRIAILSVVAIFLSVTAFAQTQPAAKTDKAKTEVKCDKKDGKACSKDEKKDACCKDKKAGEKCCKETGKACDKKAGECKDKKAAEKK